MSFHSSHWMVNGWDDEILTRFPRFEIEEVFLQFSEGQPSRVDPLGLRGNETRLRGGKWSEVVLPWRCAANRDTA